MPNPKRAAKKAARQAKRKKIRASQQKYENAYNGTTPYNTAIDLIANDSYNERFNNTGMYVDDAGQTILYQPTNNLVNKAANVLGLRKPFVKESRVVDSLQNTGTRYITDGLSPSDMNYKRGGSVIKGKTLRSLNKGSRRSK